MTEGFQVRSQASPGIFLLGPTEGPTNALVGIELVVPVERHRSYLGKVSLGASSRKSKGVFPCPFFRLDLTRNVHPGIKEIFGRLLLSSENASPLEKQLFLFHKKVQLCFFLFTESYECG